MKRREVLTAGLALTCAATFGASANGVRSWVRPGEPGWPTEYDWARLNAMVGGRLAPVTLPDLSTPEGRKLLANPYFIGDQPGLTESSGWLDAWRSSPSAYVVAAESATDVAIAVRFARSHYLRLAVKGRGHSYFGTSNAPDALLIWTRRMDDVRFDPAFVPRGTAAAPVPAVTCGAGAMWMHAYRAVSVERGRYVQGGGCATVGVAGLVQGGGFGSFSKGFGTAGAFLLEAEIVTADGQVLVVNRAQHPELFWALKGGGGGSWGVLTRLTLATHELPEFFGALNLSIRAKSDQAFRRLLAAFVKVYAERMFNPHFGEQVHAGPDNRLSLNMVFQGLKPPEARAAAQPLVDFAAAHPDDYELAQDLLATGIPARSFWDASVVAKLGAAVLDNRPEGTPGDFWWKADGSEAGTFWHAYASVWLPQSLLRPGNQARLVDAWFAASRQHSVSFHFNKGLAGAPPAALAASRDTPMNPDALDAFALAIIAASGRPAFKGMPQPNVIKARADATRVHAAMKALRTAAPSAGSYVNECDYFQPDWQRAFWGPHYERLLSIKRRYDPANLFAVHHGIGS